MRLLVLASADVIHARRWVSWFAGRGHEVRLATLEPWTAGRLAVPQHVLPAYAPLAGLKYPLAAPALARLVKEFKPGLVNAHFVPGYGFLASLVASARPLAISAWGSDVLLNPSRSPFHRWRIRRALRAAGLVTCDAAAASRALEELGVERSRILETPLGVDPEVFHSDPERLESQDRPLKIISTRRLEPLYDLETLLCGAAILKAKGLNISIDLIGEGSRRAALEKLTGSLGLARVVSFRGGLAEGDLAGALREADIYVSTALSDSTSVSLLEALASGVFPVVTDIPGNREWITHGTNGLCFASGDPRALAAGLTRAWEDRPLRRKAIEINLELVRARARWPDNMRLVEERFVELAER